MPRKRRRREDPEVIKTERDSRRADKENDDTFDLTDEEAAIMTPEYSTASISRYNRSKARKIRKTSHIADAATSFPFFLLPPEVRNMIYRYVVLSKFPDPIRLDTGGRVFTPGGLETAILLASSMVYHEAVKILYSENKFAVHFSKFQQYQPGAHFRVDDPRDAFATSRQLRNGRCVTMVNHSGLIYEEIFYRLRRVELRVDLFDATNMCKYMTTFNVECYQQLLEALCRTVKGSLSMELSFLRPRNLQWSLVVQSSGKMGYRTMHNSIKPILTAVIHSVVQDGKLKMTLDGNFPINWETMFSGMMGVNFSADKVKVVDTAGMDPPDLEARLLERRFWL